MFNYRLNSEQLIQAQNFSFQLASFGACGFMFAGVPGALGACSYYIVFNTSQSLLLKASNQVSERYEGVAQKVAKIISSILSVIFSVKLGYYAAYLAGFHFTLVASFVIPIGSLMITTVLSKIYLKVLGNKEEEKASSVDSNKVSQSSSAPIGPGIQEQLNKIAADMKRTA